MPNEDNLAIDFRLDGRGAPRQMADEIRESLTSNPRRLPSKYFYDARGSRLFERITELPEYYLTRTELALLDREARRIAELTGVELMIELGSGASKKARLLIEAGLAAGTLRRYVSVEVSQHTAERSARALAGAYPDLEVHALVGDFESHLPRDTGSGRRMVALLGSTLGNFPEPAARRLLGEIRDMLDPGDHLLLGTDLVKDRATLEAAYNDSQGVTAEFNRNILRVVNDHLDGDFDPEQFDHVARYNASEARIESSLRARRRHAVRLAAIDLGIELDAGESILTEVSCKYTRESVARLLDASGLTLQHWFTDENEAFALSLSKPVDDAG